MTHAQDADTLLIKSAGEDRIGADAHDDESFAEHAEAARSRRESATSIDADPVSDPFRTADPTPTDHPITVTRNNSDTATDCSFTTLMDSTVGQHCR
jgi:hypothetical protein